MKQAFYFILFDDNPYEYGPLKAHWRSNLSTVPADGSLSDEFETRIKMCKRELSKKSWFQLLAFRTVVDMENGEIFTEELESFRMPLRTRIELNVKAKTGLSTAKKPSVSAVIDDFLQEPMQESA